MTYDLSFHLCLLSPAAIRGLCELERGTGFPQTGSEGLWEGLWEGTPPPCLHSSVTVPEMSPLVSH